MSVFARICYFVRRHKIYKGQKLGYLIMSRKNVNITQKMHFKNLTSPNKHTHDLTQKTKLSEFS